MGVWLLGAPALTQLARVDHPGLTEWVMFAGFGLQVCTVDYSLVRPDGTRQGLDRFAVLGVEEWRDGPRSLWRVPSGEAAARIGRRMCREVALSDPDIRGVATCARRSGWKVELDGETNLCVGRPTRRAP